MRLREKRRSLKLGVRSEELGVEKQVKFCQTFTKLCGARGKALQMMIKNIISHINSKPTENIPCRFSIIIYFLLLSDFPKLLLQLQ